MGVLGRVSAYFGTVESQGWGTLHLHMLLWLSDTPSADVLQEMFKAEDFRGRVVDYIQANIRAYVPGFESAATVKALKKEPTLAYGRPPNPASLNYESQRQSFEVLLTRTEQIHTCKVNRCLILDWEGKLVCKRKAPFRTSPTDVVHENGDWACKRLFGYVNGWNPSVLVNARCNNDIKLLTNGSDTRNISFYVTAYAAKKQGKTYNLSAIMEKTFAYHLKNLSRQNCVDHRDRQRLLLTRLMYAVNREQEFAAPLVMSYLMGWGDTFRSHQYTPIYWSTFVNALRVAHPELGCSTR